MEEVSWILCLEWGGAKERPQKRTEEPEAMLGLGSTYLQSQRPAVEFRSPQAAELPGWGAVHFIYILKGRNAPCLASAWRITVLKIHMINIISIILRSFLKECCPAISRTLKSRLDDYVGTPVPGSGSSPYHHPLGNSCRPHWTHHQESPLHGLNYALVTDNDHQGNLWVPRAQQQREGWASDGARVPITMIRITKPVVLNSHSKILGCSAFSLLLKPSSSSLPPPPLLPEPLTQESP